MKDQSQEVAGLFQDLVRALVDDPSMVSVEPLHGEQCTVLEISVGMDDFSKVIGRKGRTATALRNIAQCVSGAKQYRYLLEFPEPVREVHKDEIGHVGPSEPPGAEETLQLLNRLIRAIVDLPDQVSLNLLDGLRASVLEITVAPVDVSRIIGRKGGTADAIRVLLTNVGARSGRTYHMEIVEPDGASRVAGPRRNTGPRELFSHDKGLPPTVVNRGPGHRRNRRHVEPPGMSPGF